MLDSIGNIVDSFLPYIILWNVMGISVVFHDPPVSMGNTFGPERADPSAGSISGDGSICHVTFYNICVD